MCASIAVSAQEYVNLGLTSRTLWATTNLGAASETEAGNHYAWGETSTKESYNRLTYALASGMTEESQDLNDYLTSYYATDGLTTLSSANDAATATWGSTWVTPTPAQCQELLDECTWTIEGNGYRVTGKNGNSIYLPMAGLKYNGTVDTQNYGGCYMTNTLSLDTPPTSYAFCRFMDIRISSDYKNIYGLGRFYGFSVRPVSTELAPEEEEEEETENIAITTGCHKSSYAWACTSNGTEYGTPFNVNKYNISERIIPASDINYVGNISEFCIYLYSQDADGSGISEIPYDDVKIYMRYVEKDNYADANDYAPIDQMTLVYSGSANIGTKEKLEFYFKSSSGYLWKYPIKLENPFSYNGKDNLEIVVITKCGETTFSNYTIVNSLQTFPNYSQNTIYKSSNTEIDPNTSGFSFSSTWMPQLAISINYTKGLLYERIGNRAVVKGYDHEITKVTIPASITIEGDELAVDSIAPDAFKGSAIEDITLLGNIAYIDGRFSGCASLKTITGLTNTKIGDSTFSGCSSLTNIDLSACTSIGGSAFSGCSSLTNIDLSACTSVGDNAFSGCSALKSVNNWSCTSLSAQVFSGCPALTNIDLSKCTSIGNYAFDGCSSLTNIDLSKCTSIGNYAFDGCSSLTNIDLSACTSIGNYAFDGCSSLTNIDLSACTSIGDYAFDGCSSLKSIDNWSCTSIGYKAFNNCTSLKSVSNLTCPNLDTYAFYGCTALESINKLTCGGISSATFAGCDALTSLKDLTCTSIANETFKDRTTIEIEGLSCTSIGNKAFYRCYGLKSLGDLSACTSIGDDAFRGCSSLQSIGDLSACTSIGNYAFEYCSSLQSIGDLSACTSIGSSAFLCCTSLQSIGDLSACTSIGDDAFLYCSRLQSIGDLSACTSIEYGAFLYCSSLQSIGDLSACTSIGSDAFKYCSSLARFIIPNQSIPKYITNAYIKDYLANKNKYVSEGSVTLPDSIHGIPDNAFKNFVNIKEIHAGSLDSIGANAFYNCTALERVEVGDVTKMMGTSAISNTNGNLVCIFNGTSPANLESTNFFDNSCLIYVPAESLDTYRTAVNWQGHASQILAIGCKEDYDVTVSAETTLSALHVAIGENNLQNVTKLKVSGTINGYDLMLMRNKMTNLKNLDLSEASIVTDPYEYYTGYSSIDNTLTRYALPDNLLSLKLPNTLQYIKSYALSDFKFLQKLEIPANVITIEANAANGNTATDFDFSKDKVITSIGDNAFYGCTKLTKVELTGSLLKTLGSNVFKNCTSMEIACFDNTKLTVLPASAFENSGLKSFNIPSHITRVKECALGKCNSLSSLTIADCDSPLLIYNQRVDLSEVSWQHNYDYTYDYKNIKSVYIGRNIDINTNDDGVRGFSNHTSLNTVELGGNITTIPYRMFDGCTALEKVTGTNLIDSISSYAFKGCSKLSHFEFNSNIKTIPEYSFNGCSSLDAIDIPVSVTTLGQHAFDGCSTAQTCTLPINSKIDSIPTYAFANCTSLTKVDLPQSVRKIEDYAFQNCTNMTEAKLSSAINKVGDYAFNGCTNLFDVYTYTIEPQAIDQNTFSQFSGATLHVPQVSWYNYYYNTQWSQFQKLVNFDEPYSYAYVENDYTLRTDEVGILQGNPEFDIWGGGTIEIFGLRIQPSRKCLIRCEGGKWGSVIPKSVNFTPDTMYVEMDVKKDFWYAFSFPFDVDLNKVKKDGDWVFRRYDGSMRAANGSGGWQGVEGTTLKANTGYIFRTNKAGKLSIPTSKAPDLSPVDKEMELEEHTSTIGAEHGSWNFIGNPFLSYYSMNDMDYTAPIVVWNGTSYEAFRPGDDDHVFHPFEPFFVQRPQNVEKVGFSKDYRAGYNEIMENVAESRMSASCARNAKKLNAGVNRNLINIALSNGNATDKTRVVYNNSQKMDYEAECDASKFVSTSAGVQVYSIDDNGVKYAINERPLGNGSVMLGYVANVAGEYTLSAPRMDVPVVIRDNKENVTFNLSEGDYTFTTDAGTFDSRFAIMVAGGTTAIEGLNANSDSDKNVIYDLNGRRTDKVGNGVNIINGKKQIVKSL